ncbi:MAG: hypothetical protein PUD92_00040 [Clostridiales bacterium]|nr:hypothetical protein [Clostridiales bacterium]
MPEIATENNLNKWRSEVAKSPTVTSGAGTVKYTAAPKTQATPNVLQSSGGTSAQQSPMSGIRNRLTGIGFENDKIGYDNNSGFVTYNGQNIVKADGIDENGSSYAADDAIIKGAYNYITNNGYIPARQAITDRNINNSRIGYDEKSGMVQVDGNNQLKPQFNIDGTTYATENDINRAVNGAYAATGDKLYAAADYIAGLGIGANVKYDTENGTVHIGGSIIKPAYVSDGIAYIPKSQLDAAAEAYKANNGYSTPKGVNEQYEERYGGKVDEALSRLTNREGFSWSPEEDEAFRAYKNQQMRLAEEAYRKVLNDNNTSAYGASGAVLSEALAAQNRYIESLEADQMDFMDRAYERYLGETSRLRDNLEDTRAVANDYYSRAYTQNTDTYNRSRQDRLDNWQRQKDELANEYQRLLNEGYTYDNTSRAASAKYADSNAYEALRAAQLANAATAFDNGTKSASTLGKFLPEDETWLPGLKNFRETDPVTGEWTGGYSLGPWDSELKYTMAMKGAENGQVLQNNIVSSALASALNSVNPDGTPITGTPEQTTQLNQAIANIKLSAYDKLLSGVLGQQALPAGQ